MEANRTNCDIVRDLLPLYVDSVCSAASAKMVEDHTAECESCADELEKMRNAAATEDRSSREQNAVSSFAGEVRRRTRKKAIWTAIIASVSAAALVLAVLSALFGIEKAVPYDASKITVELPSDGGVDVRIDDKYSMTYAQVFDNGDGTEDVYLTAVCDLYTFLRGEESEADKADNIVRFGNDLICSYNEETMHCYEQTGKVAHIWYYSADGAGRGVVRIRYDDLAECNREKCALIYENKEAN